MSERKKIEPWDLTNRAHQLAGDAQRLSDLIEQFTQRIAHLEAENARLLERLRDLDVQAILANMPYQNPRGESA